MIIIIKYDVRIVWNIFFIDIIFYDAIILSPTQIFIIIFPIRIYDILYILLHMVPFLIRYLINCQFLWHL